MYLFFMIEIADLRVLWRHFRSNSGFIGCWKNFLKKFSQKILLHQKIRRKISGGVFGSIFHLWPRLVGVITDFDPYVSKLTNKSATRFKCTYRLNFKDTENHIKLIKIPKSELTWQRRFLHFPRFRNEIHILVLCVTFFRSRGTSLMIEL